MTRRLGIRDGRGDGKNRIQYESVEIMIGACTVNTAYVLMNSNVTCDIGKGGAFARVRKVEHGQIAKSENRKER